MAKQFTLFVFGVLLGALFCNVAAGAPKAQPASTTTGTQQTGSHPVSLNFEALTPDVAAGLGDASKGNVAMCYELNAPSGESPSLRRLVPEKGRNAQPTGTEDSGTISFYTKPPNTKDPVYTPVACRPRAKIDGPALPAGGRLYLIVRSSDIGDKCSNLNSVNKSAAVADDDEKAGGRPTAKQLSDGLAQAKKYRAADTTDAQMQADDKLVGELETTLAALKGESDAKTHFVTTVSLDQTKESVIDSDPLRTPGSAPAATTSVTTPGTLAEHDLNRNVPTREELSALAASANAPASPTTDTKTSCYARYPGQLAADTYTVANISVTNAKDAQAEAKAQEQAAAAGKPAPPTKAVKHSDVLPEIHTYYRFGFDQGLVHSTVKSRTFAYAPETSLTAPTSSTAYSYVISSSTSTIDPVLFVHWYFVGNGFHWVGGTGIDPEFQSWWPDFSLVIGLSEKNPTTSYYAGLSAEVVRNVSVVVGMNRAQESQIAYGALDAGPGTTGQNKPPTANHYESGFFVGLSFGWSNFLQSVLK